MLIRSDARTSPAVLITGISRGIGLALADTFSHAGFHVIGVFRDPNQESLLKSRFGSAFTPVVADISTDACVGAITHALEASVHKLDVLINNAGAPGQNTTLATQDTQHIQYLFNLNCVGSIRVSKAAEPYLLRSDSPLVINISSRFGSISHIADGRLNLEASYSYRISKAALNMFSACMAQEYRKTNLKIISIHPGAVKTRSGNTDANLLPESSAERILKYVFKHPSLPKCSFVEAGDRELGW
jgi:NAD(P)-dependent dehydrogenase (short-subunit alcohol dehydrogenase family)